MEIIIAGDFSLQGRMKDCHDVARIESALGEHLKTILQQSDHAIVNYEGASTNEPKGILKDGPCLKNAPEGMKALKNAGFDIVSLANNHVGDYSFRGVMDTLRLCEENGMMHVGAGKNLEAASSPLIIDNVAILNVCEAEALIATRSTPGLAPIDLISLHYSIKSLRGKAEYVVVIVHGGCEHYPLPTPRMKRVYRYLIELGADAVVSHHQHCYCGYEVFQGKPIFYGLGNFFFDWNRSGKPWNEGYMVKLKLDGEVGFEIIPYRQCDSAPVLEWLETDAFSERLDALNAVIASDELLEEEFDKLVATKRLLSVFLPYSNHYLTEMYVRGWLPSCLPKRKLAKMISRIKCETHNEVILRSFSPDYLNLGRVPEE